MPSRLTNFMPLARLRGFGWWRLLQFAVVAAGLIAMTALTETTLPAAQRMTLSALLWCCLGYFVAEWTFHLLRAFRT